ncbi:MAG TPA: DNA primase, partial [Ruminococcaceae bacterium]|nr:DNA primase [Oscillospiraceae bacterium]
LMSPAGARALEYIHGRALTDKTIRKFGLGYAPDSWNALTNHLKAKGFTENEMLAAAVAAKGRNNGFYDMFRNRIIFPIIDLRGNVIAFGGRVMDDSKPKYLNSGDTPVFKKSKNLFAMNIAKSVKSDSIILCEGYMDVIALHQAGFENTVATLGTALAAEQSHLISQYCSQVILSYDSDAAGQQAAKKAINLFAQTGVKVKVLTVKGAKDPDEFIKKYGRERFKMLIDGCENAIEYEISKIKDKYNMETADGKVSFLKEFCALMSQINSPIEREIYISRYALELEIDKAAVAAQVQSLFKKRVKAQQAKQERSLNIFVNSTPDKQKDFERSKNLQCALAEDKLITALIKNPDYYKYILSKISSRDFITTRNREIFEILCQRLENSLSIELFELSSVLDDNAMSAIAFLVASSNGISYSRADVDEYISILLQNKSKKSESEIAQMSDDELMSFIGSLSRK